MVKMGNFQTDKNLMHMRYYKLHPKFIILFLYWDGLALYCAYRGDLSGSETSLALQKVEKDSYIISSVLILATSVSQNDNGSCSLREGNKPCILRIQFLSH